MTDLFGHTTFFEYQFPEPQYLGSKFIHRNWIGSFVPDDIDVVLDGFGGSQSISYYLKQAGKTVYTNDFLNFNNQIGLALIENSNVKLTNDDLQILFRENQNPSFYNLFENLYVNLFFNKGECAFIDAYRSNIPDLDCKYKQALAFTIMCRAMTRKVTMGHFAHTKAMEYAANLDRIKRNRSLIRPLKEIVKELVFNYNKAVFDNGKNNQSFCLNTLELLPTLNNIELAYFDPPYCDSHADYQSFYHLLETFVQYWKDKNFVNSIRRYDPKIDSGFDKKADILNSLDILFEGAKNIPIWLISYNDRSYPTTSIFMNLIKRHRSVELVDKPYINGRGGKGSVAGSKEILLICNK